MFDVVPADENEASSSVYSCSIEDLQTGLAVPPTPDEWRRRPTAHDQEHRDEEQQRDANTAGSKKEATSISAHQVIEHLHVLPLRLSTT
jgi:hypothetical protein